MWVYIHARTVARVWPRLKRPARDDSRAVQQLLRRAIESKERFSILQVGAFDGVSNDPLHQLIRDYPHVRAVLLEPQPGPYASLETLWRDCDRVTTLRSAIADTCGERPMYVIADNYKSRHPFADQVASFCRSHVELNCSRYMWRPPQDCIAAVSVPTVNFRTLSETYGPFNLVSIDVEGYDGDVLHQMDLDRTRPDIILYEHRCLTRDMKLRAVAVLERAGFAVRQVNKSDSLALAPGLALGDQ